MGPSTKSNIAIDGGDSPILVYSTTLESIFIKFVCLVMDLYFEDFNYTMQKIDTEKYSLKNGKDKIDFIYVEFNYHNSIL